MTWEDWDDNRRRKPGGMCDHGGARVGEQTGKKGDSIKSAPKSRLSVEGDKTKPG